MSGSPPPSAALVTALRWKSGAAAFYTTVVAKITMQLRDDGRAALVQPEPFVLFDRLASDPRFVTEASELLPWTVGASLIADGGPLQLSLRGEAPQATFSASLPAGAPVGFSMASPERAGFAPERPTRGSDGLLTIPDDLDGRYFMAAGTACRFPALRGDELFTLELPGFRTQRALPGMVVEVTLRVGTQQRVVALTADMLVVSAATRRLSLVSRALLRGEAALSSHAVLPFDRATSTDRGDTRAVQGSARAASGVEETAVLSAHDMSAMALGPGDETSDISAAELASLGALAAPFMLEPASDRSPHPAKSRALPATPFDPGFVAQPVQPGVGVLATLSPDEEMAQKLDAMRRQLRGSAPAGASPALPAEQASAKVAPPKPGAMAKPRFKRK